MAMPTYEHELESLHELELEGEGELEAELEGEGEAEGEGELELEGEGEVSPVRKIYADAMMEHLAHMAAEAESEQEAAEHFLPLIGLAAKKLLPVVAKAVAPSLRRALPQMARAVTRVEPQLTRGIAKIARGLYRQPGTRRLLHAVPAIARRTVHSIARQAATGRPLTPRGAVHTLARQARWVLGRRPYRLRALRRSHLLDRRFHKHIGPGVIRSHLGTQYTTGGGVPAGVPGAASAIGQARAVGRSTVCPPCNGQSSAAPAYCRCCGQLLR
jgi:hypothetical protein